MLQKIIGISLFLMCAVNFGFAQNYKIKQVTTMNGQKTDSIVYVKGARKRSEGGGFMGMGGDVATVEQCDLKRDLKINDKKKMYSIEPFDDGTETAPTTPVSKTQTPRAKIVKGGVITYVSNITDTGERKQMFGLTARHVKTSMSMESSPDACSKEKMKMETDGWYVDLPEFSCPLTARPRIPQIPSDGASGGCRDRMQFKTTGGGKLGFPLTETRKMEMGDGEMSFTQSVETLEFSKATLAPALFDIPQGYALTSNPQDLYGKPDMAAMMRSMANSDDDDDEKPQNKPQNNSKIPQSSPNAAKKPGMIRIGVYAPTNKSGENVSITNLQSFLIQKLIGGNVEAVGISSETDARAANCDYILTSEFSKLKQSTTSKIGGMFGKITNTDASSARNYDAQIDFKLVSLADGKTFAAKAANKTESDVDRAAESVLSLEAAQILGKVQ